jgi:hypothetical protein
MVRPLLFDNLGMWISGCNVLCGHRLYRRIATPFQFDFGLNCELQVHLCFMQRSS